MTIFSSVRLALQAIRRHVLRSALTTLGIVLGVAAVITMMAVGAGARAEIEARLRRIGSNDLTVRAGSVTSGGIRLGHGAALTLTEEDAEAIARGVPGGGLGGGE